jgi:hypothetical protein
MGILSTAAGGAKKWTWWGRVVAVAEVALVAKRHLDLLGPGEVAELRRLLVRSKGRPGNLTSRELKRIQELVVKLEPGAFARDASATFAPFGRRKS